MKSNNNLPKKGKQNNNNKPKQSKAKPDKSAIAPVAKSQIFTAKKPNFRPSPNGDVTITHEEYVSEVAGSVAFASTTYPINPGLPGLFPWLSIIAQRYESYMFSKLEFRFKTESATTATGAIILGVDYDSSDAAPENKTQIMAYRNSVRSAPWDNSVHSSSLEDLSKRKSLFIRAGNLAANQDIKLYDAGNLFVCRQGQAGTTSAGELYVKYTVKLMTPQMGEAGVGAAVYGSYGGASNAAPLATLISGNLPVTVASAGTTTSSSTFTFTQPWHGDVTITAQGTGLTSIAVAGSTAIAVEVFDVANAGATAYITFNFVNAVNIGDTLLVTIANTTITEGRIYFGQADN